jgi:hypothetical protein
MTAPRTAADWRRELIALADSTPGPRVSITKAQLLWLLEAEAAPYREALERLVEAIWAVQHAEDNDEEAESKLEHAKAYAEARALLDGSAGSEQTEGLRL